MVKIGFLGLGWIADWHFNAIQKCPGVEVKGAFSPPAPGVAERFVRMGIHEYESMEAMLSDEDLDAVAVLTPTHLHCEHTLAVLNAGKHALVEKPVALDAEQHRKMTEAAEANNKVLFPAHNFVYRPVVRKAHEIIASGALGTISYGSFRAIHFIPEEASSGWRKSNRFAGGGAMIDSGMHLVYQSLYLLGKPSWVSAFSAKKHYTELDDEDIAQISMQYGDGTIGQVLQSWASHDDTAGEIRILGNKGNLLISDALYLNGEKVEDDAAYPDSFKHLNNHFAACIRGEAKPLSTMEDALTSFDIIQKGYTAAAEKSVLSLE